MKKIFTCLVFIGLSLSGLQAQKIAGSNIRQWGIGLLGGLNRATPIRFNNQKLANAPQINAVIGLDLYYQFSRQSSFHFQPSWTTIKYGKAVFNNWDELVFNIATIKIPLVYRYQFLPTKISPFVETGMSYNKAVSGSYTEFVPCDFCSDHTNGYTTSYGLATRPAMSILGGVGVNIHLKTISIPIQVRYERYVGYQSFLTDTPVYNPRIKFENIAILTGISF